MSASSLSITAQYTSGEGLGGGTLMSGWSGRLLKEWTVQTTISLGTGLPETPIYPEAVPGTGSNSSIRPDLTGAPLYSGAKGGACERGSLHRAGSRTMGNRRQGFCYRPGTVHS